MPTPLSLNWSAQGADETSIAGGFTQNTGGINVGVTYVDDGLGNQFDVETSQTQYVGAGEPMATNSAVELRGDAGVGDTSTTTIDFSSASGSGFSGEVEDVIFRINDVDINTWTDLVAVRAYDANGNQIDVSLTYQGTTTTGTDPSVTGAGGNVTAATASGSVLVNIAGPVAYFEIDYGNNGTGAQALWVTDVHFDAIELDGTVEGSSGNDVIDDTYILDPDGDKVDNGDAILPGYSADGDLIYAYGGNDTVIAGEGDDSVYGGSGSDSVSGGAGDDTVLLGSGNDTFGGSTAEAGNDTVFGGGGADSIDGGSGNDELRGGGGNDTITGGTGNDSLRGGRGNDLFNIADDHDGDIIRGGEDTGGADVDIIDFSNSTSTQGVTVTATGGEAGTYDFDGTSGTGTYNQIEGFDGTDFDDTFNLTLDGGGTSVTAGAGDDRVFGGAGGDTIDGGADDDLLSGGDGGDTIFGGSGDDEISLGAGNDTGYGGLGRDYFQFGDADGTNVIEGGEGDDGIGDILNSNDSTPVNVTTTGDEAGVFTTGTTTVTFSEIEIIQTDDGNDTVDLTGDSAGMTVFSYAGDDTITGGSGDDSILAGDGDDVIDGNEGADRISAGTGDDTVTFSEGDSVSGGAGDDLFVLEDLGELSNGTITIDGGAGDETGGLTGGDTLQLGDLGILSQAVRDTFINDGTGSFSGSITLDDGTILNFSEIENIICFTPNTRIATPKGLIAIEDLEVGDMVVTRDHGLQPIRWIEGRTVPAVDRFAPIRIRKNVLSGQERDLIVSPQHRVLFQGYRAELLFGESEVLVAAKHLVDGMDVTQDESNMVTYVHMLFDEHEIIFAEGAATESFHPGDIGFSAVGAAAREELFKIFPELRVDPRHYGNTARRCLKSHEAKLIRT